ncbi:hypothetical protein SAMN05216368_102134 [Cryobacterium flavum]|uniref:Uncharacterized protein n=1 Tax=Cryobacterium flavum TaxID=1424659 RepID=A0A4R8VDL6_9MICO|nr:MULTISPECIES: hypothetical protein [Cryobacterium]TFB81139.1 hypothetical protein E3O21_04625 [Cryobacterium flavum]TFD11020.1 hypothetical protein E3T35_10550 [Cryobacterium sp. TMT1-2-2]SDM73985.1 hypothetical protein SAMN05216368_102134 [Cryobacterium flavum]
MELLLGVVLIAISTALGLVEASRISGPNRGSGTFVKFKGRQRLPALVWRMLQIALLVSGVGILQNELGGWAYLIFGIVLVLPLIFGLWRNARRPADA